ELDAVFVDAVRADVVGRAFLVERLRREGEDREALILVLRIYLLLERAVLVGVAAERRAVHDEEDAAFESAERKLVVLEEARRTEGIELAGLSAAARVGRPVRRRP